MHCVRTVGWQNSKYAWIVDEGVCMNDGGGGRKSGLFLSTVVQGLPGSHWLGKLGIRKLWWTLSLWLGSLCTWSILGGCDGHSARSFTRSGKFEEIFLGLGRTCESSTHFKRGDFRKVTCADRRHVLPRTGLKCQTASETQNGTNEWHRSFRVEKRSRECDACYTQFTFRPKKVSMIFNYCT